MKLKKTLFMILIALVCILGTTTVNAATISDNGKYSLILTADDYDANIDGEYYKLIRFNADDGETTVKLSELTKDIIPFNGVKEFSHWVRSDGKIASEDLLLTDFTYNGDFYNSKGEYFQYTNGLTLFPKFEGKTLEEGDKYYVTLDAFGGTINGQSQILLVSESSEFTTIDLTKYVPVRKGHTFKGWDLNGKFVTSIDSSTFSKKVSINVVATYTLDTFTGDDRVLILNANGGTISGDTSNKYDYVAGGNSGTSMSLLPYIPVRKGYTFNGWNSKKDGSGKNYTYIYWRLWDKDNRDNLDSDTIIINANGAEYYQNVTLYASWIKNSGDDETVKEIESTGAIKGSITFENEVSKDYILDIKQIEISEKLKAKNVKYLVDINLLENNQKLEVNGIKMKIKIALPEALKGYSNYEVVYVINDEIKGNILATIEDGYIVFETSHLSQYGIVATADTGIENPKTVDNISIYLTTAILSIIGLAGVSLIAYRKKQTN